jgi:hypothetical protein
MVLQERTLGLTLLRKLPRCAPGEMATAVIMRLKDLPAVMRWSITFDNGQENRAHLRMREELNLGHLLLRSLQHMAERQRGARRRSDQKILAQEDRLCLDLRQGNLYSGVVAEHTTPKALRLSLAP